MLTIHSFLYLFHIKQKNKKHLHKNASMSWIKLATYILKIMTILRPHICIFSPKLRVDRSKSVTFMPAWFPKVKVKHSSGSAWHRCRFSSAPHVWSAVTTFYCPGCLWGWTIIPDLATVLWLLPYGESNCSWKPFLCPLLLKHSWHAE